MKSLGGAAAANASSLEELGQTILDDSDADGDELDGVGDGLKEKIKKRREYRENNGGATVDLGNINKDSVNLHGTVTNELNHGHSVEELLEEGWAPEDIVRENPEGVSLNPNNELKYRVAVQNEISIDVVQIGKYHTAPSSPETHASNLRKAFSEIPTDEGLDIDINADTITPDQEVFEQLANIAEGGKARRKANQFLKENYSDTGRLSLFIVEGNIDGNPDSVGHANYSANIGYVETQKITYNVDGTVVHECGHGVLRLGHHFLREGAMSYNLIKNIPLIGDDTTFSGWSKLAAKRFLDGEIKCEVVDTDYGKEIDWEYNAGELSGRNEKEAEKWFQKNFERFLSDKLSYNMGPWSKVDYEQVEEDGEVLDKITYQYKNTALHQEFTIDNFIKDVSYFTA